VHDAGDEVELVPCRRGRVERGREDVELTGRAERLLGREPFRDDATQVVELACAGDDHHVVVGQASPPEDRRILLRLRFAPDAVHEGHRVDGVPGVERVEVVGGGVGVLRCCREILERHGGGVVGTLLVRALDRLEPADIVIRVARRLAVGVGPRGDVARSAVEQRACGEAVRVRRDVGNAGIGVRWRHGMADAADGRAHQRVARLFVDVVDPHPLTVGVGGIDDVVVAPPFVVGEVGDGELAVAQVLDEVRDGAVVAQRGRAVALPHDRPLGVQHLERRRDARPRRAPQRAPERGDAAVRLGGGTREGDLQVVGRRVRAARVRGDGGHVVAVDLGLAHVHEAHDVSEAVVLERVPRLLADRAAGLVPEVLDLALLRCDGHAQEPDAGLVTG
jgi:hypothetical protein